MDMYDIVEQILKEKGMNKKQLAEKIQVPYASLISAFQRHSKSFSVKHQDKILDAIDVSFWDYSERLFGKEVIELRLSNVAMDGLVSILRKIYDKVSIEYHCICDNEGVPDYDGNYTVFLSKTNEQEIELSKIEFEILFDMICGTIPSQIQTVQKIRELSEVFLADQADD